MSGLPADVPIPAAEVWEQAFWDHCAERRLMFQACADCGTLRHPPMPFCPNCRSRRTGWLEAKGPAILFSHTRTHHPSHPALNEAVPYWIAVVEFPEMQNVRLLTNLIDMGETEVRIGMPLSLVWEEPQPGKVLPRFTVAGDAT